MTLTSLGRLRREAAIFVSLVKANGSRIRATASEVALHQWSAINDMLDHRGRPGLPRPGLLR